MKGELLLDTGPLVSLLSNREPYHEWAKQAFAAVRRPMLTCESVISEACFLLRQTQNGAAAVLGLLDRNVVRVSFRLEDEFRAVAKLVSKYSSVPMSLADACLVRMSETTPGAVVVTLDSDFRIYRRQGRLTVPTMMPPGI